MGDTGDRLIFSFELIEENKTKAFIRFLNTKDAPDILHRGVIFELFEGEKKVADGEVIEETIYDFENDK